MDNTDTDDKNQPFDQKNYDNGIYRKKVGDKFNYFYVKNNKPVSTKDQERINKLRIPPAWTEVWISADPSTPIQAIGYDSKERKQYRYHDKHIEVAEKKKFIRLYKFIQSIPKLDEVMKKHRKGRPYDKDRVISTMLEIVKELHMRVGKECYAQQNKSYGISSLRKYHVRIDKDVVTFKFRAKSKKQVTYTLVNDSVLKHIEVLLKLDGGRLFQYVDEEGKTRNVTDMDLNRYIQEFMGKEFTVKDFRTYAANFYFLRALLQETQKRSPKNNKVIKKNITTAIKKTAYYLKHTKAISKKSYIMNFCIEMYQETPEWFVARKLNDPDSVLLSVLQKYKKNHSYE